MKDYNEPIESYFGDVKTAHIDALYRDGKFYDQLSKKEIRFLENKRQNSEGVRLKIIVPFHHLDLNDETNLHHKKKEVRELFPAGEKLIFQLDYRKENKKFEFRIQILDNLKMERVGNKFWKLNGCKCVLIDGIELFKNNPIEVPRMEYGSLNQLLVQTSMHFRPFSGSHTCNAFKTFRTLDGKLLEDLR